MLIDWLFKTAFANISMVLAFFNLWGIFRGVLGTKTYKGYNCISLTQNGTKVATFWLHFFKMATIWQRFCAKLLQGQHQKKCHFKHFLAIFVNF